MLKLTREIERKLVVRTGATRESVDSVITHELMFMENEIIRGHSIDLYWRAPIDGGRADFIRLRELEDGKCELTAKCQDKGSNVDRIEINVNIPDRPQLVNYMNLVHGEPTIRIEKSYTVFVLSPVLNVSTYRVKGDKRVFVEVEGPNIETVDAVINQLSSRLTLLQECRSLFEIFAGPARLNPMVMTYARFE